MSQNLPDPSSVPAAEDDPRPERTRRRFAGTQKQIKAAATFYKVAAWITGVMLLLLVVEMILRYGFDVFLYAGGTTVANGTDNVLSLAADGAVVDGVNVSIVVLIAHGWLYVLYLLAVFLLWSRMRWGLGQFIAIALGGVVPFLSFIMEARVHKQVMRELDSHPEAVRRY